MVAGERRYEVLNVLGQGGFGTVFHARLLGEGGFTKEVALKVLNPDMENVAEIASRLRDEARVLGLIRHRAIVGVDSLTQLDGRWTVVMEYVEGRDCTQFLQSGPIPVGPALEIAAEIAGALHAAYSKVGQNGQPLRLLHRDLKPSNIRITPFGEVKVLDFGIARAEFGGRESITRSLAFGTPEYMSPERLDFSGDTAAGDVYALGVVLYELLTATQYGRSSANPAKHARKLESAMIALQTQQMPKPVRMLLTQMLSFDDQSRPTAADIEKRAVTLARGVGGATLREWIDEQKMDVEPASTTTSPLTGSILIERPDVADGPPTTHWERATPHPDSGPRVSPTSAPLAPAETGIVAAEPAGVTNGIERRAGQQARVPTSPVQRRVLRLAIPSIIVASFSLLIWWFRGPEQPAVPSEPIVDVIEVASASAAPESPTAPTAPVDSVQSAQPNTAGVPTESKGVPAPPAPAPATSSGGAAQRGSSARTEPAPPKPPKSTASAQTEVQSTVYVGLAGDVTNVELVAGSRRIPLPGEVPIGSYEIWAIFRGESRVPAGTAEIKDSTAASVRVRCKLDFGKCSLETASR